MHDEKPKRRKGILLARWCIWFLFGASVYFILEYVWPGVRNSATERMAQALIVSGLMCLSSFSGALQPSKPQNITIDGDVIVVKRNGTFHRMPLGDIRTVLETKGNILRDGGLLLSDKTLFRARLLGGFLWIPEEAPDYAYLKSLVDMRTNTAR